MPRLIIRIRRPIAEFQHTFTIPTASLRADSHLEIRLEGNEETLELAVARVEEDKAEDMPIDMEVDVEDNMEVDMRDEIEVDLGDDIDDIQVHS
jgi:hypothetical protein